jgi:transcriptional regulator with XRE-family HTH domain
MQINAQALKALRQTGGDSQKSLAGRAGISVVALYRIENRIANPRPKTIQKLADALSVPVGAITNIDQKVDS